MYLFNVKIKLGDRMKKIHIYTSIALFFIVTIVLSITFSFFIPNILNSTIPNSTTKINNKNIEVNYTNGPNVLIDKNNKTITKEIVIKNNTDSQTDYYISLEDVLNSLPSNGTYSYTCTGGCITRTDVLPKVSSTSLTLYQTINNNTTHIYQFTYTYVGNLDNEQFQGRINVIKPNIINQYNLVGYYSSRTSMTEITYQNSINVPGNAINSWDVSSRNNGSVMAYTLDDGLGANTYKLYVQANGEVHANSSGSYLFHGWNKLKHANLEYLNTANVINLVAGFYECKNLISINFGFFDTSKITTMSSLFYDCNNLESLDLSSFDTSKVTSIDQMFYYCYKLEELDLSSFDTSEVTQMQYLFADCNSLNTLDLSSFDTSNVLTIYDMFENCSSIITLDLSHFDTSKVTNMNGMFTGCNELTSVDLSSFVTNTITSLRNLFMYCAKLTSINMRNMEFGLVSSYDYMFYNVPAGVNILVKNQAAKDFILLRKSNANVTIYT